MRLSLTICAALVSGCGAGSPTVTPVASYVPADLLTPCAGWQGPVPLTEGQWVDATAQERRGRICANGKLASVAQIVSQ
jgi:hypothetical protein